MFKHIWILLETCSTSEVFCSKFLVRDVRHMGGKFIITHLKYGTRKSNQEATLKRYGTVWFEKGVILKFLLFHWVR